MEFLEIPLFDDDIFKMLFRLCINLLITTIVIWFFYYKRTRRRDYLFTYYMISLIVFFLCFTLKKFQMDIGMALGLFAIFGILRYRTGTIEIKEMTYLFIVIGVSIINALANKNMSYAEIIGANVIIITAIAILENCSLLKNRTTKEVVYEKIEYMKSENRGLLQRDLEERMGVTVNRISIVKIDFLRDVSVLQVSYTEKL